MLEWHRERTPTLQQATRHHISLTRLLAIRPTDTAPSEQLVEMAGNLPSLTGHQRVADLT